MKRILSALRKGGPLHAGRVVAGRVVDFWHERRLGIRSIGLVPIETLIDDYTDCHDYFPTSFAGFRTAMSEVAVSPGEVFIDYGSGKGRALIMAAQYPFRRIVGVEISPELNAVARSNLDRCKGRLRCRDIELWTGSAADFPVPPDASVVYLYNPFHGQVLRAVLMNLRASLDASPRRLRLVYNNPVHFLRIASEYPWLVERRRFQLEHDCIVFDAR
jgi:SAM-dependent methyltransferase